MKFWTLLFFMLATKTYASEKDLYENGGLSKKAIAGINSGKPTVEQAVEAVFSTTKQSDQPEPQLQGRV